MAGLAVDAHDVTLLSVEMHSPEFCPKSQVAVNLVKVLDGPICC